MASQSMGVEAAGVARALRWEPVLAIALVVLSMGACSSDDGDGSPEPANLTVRRRIAALAPAAVFAHRGRGPTRAGNPYPENSLAAFRAALADHTDGLEMDVELTRDGRLILMHDDTVDRTTECRGCVSALDFDALRDCRLLGEDDRPSDQFPPTLDEVAELEPTDALLNVELKVFGDACTGPGHDAVDLATAMVAELRRLGIEHRTVVQSFDATALASVKAQAPDIYTAFLVTGLRPRDIDAAVEIGADALQPGGPFPFVNLAPELLAVAAAAGLQAIPWTVNDADSIHELLAAGVDGIITDEPGLAKSIVDARR